jgi:hypothetical protein
MEALCLSITLSIFFAHYYFLSSLRPSGVLYKLLAASVLTCAQIILTELSLGLFNLLYLSFVVIMNLSIAALVLSLGRRSGLGSRARLQDDVVCAKEAVRTAFDGYSIVLGALVVLLYGWILVAAYYLPARGIDDIAYHLPAVFEYVRSHGIRLLPLATPPFAYPENAELLFLWPVLFAHNQTMVDGINVPFVLLSVLAVYALARHFSLPKDDSLFAALLYALCPVVMMQAGVNYVDIIVSVFLLLSTYFTLRYYERQRWLDISLAGLSIGLMCGMKYTAPFLALPLQLLIVPALRKRKRHAIGYVSIILLAGGWWYVRNAYILGAPLYPMHFQARVPDGLVNFGEGSILQNIRYNLPYWITRYPLQDNKVGTYDGGFGLVFWGICFSSWIYMAFQSVVHFRKSGLPRLVMLSYLPAGFLLLLSFPPRFVDYNGRLAMFVVAIGLFAFSEVLGSIQDRVYKAIIKSICVALSVITVTLLFESVQPLYRFGAAFTDERNQTHTSEFKYLAASFIPHVDLGPAWELLDLLSREGPGGLNCFIASDSALYWSSPAYGSRLQNRVLNMGGEEQPQADAIVGMFLDKNLLGDPLTMSGALSDPGLLGATTIRDVLAKDDYVRVVHSDHSCLLLRRDIFSLPEKQRILQAYYRDAWPEAIDLAAQLDTRLDPNVPVIATNEIGYGVLYLDMRMGRPERVHLVFDNGEDEVASSRNMKACYTFQRPLSGYRSWKISQMVYKGKELDVFLNRRF